MADVEADSAAARAKLRRGDVISRVNGQVVSSPAGFYQAVANVIGTIDLTLPTSPSESKSKTIMVKLEPK